jgi:predicted dithiol-disulfide oxidoreductase (DUF899 family)
LESTRSGLGPARLLEADKEHRRRGDELARRRQEPSWMSVEKEYVFATADGRRRAPAFSRNVRCIRG